MTTRTLSGPALDQALPNLRHGYTSGSHDAGTYVTVHGPALPGQDWPVRVSVPVVVERLPYRRTSQPGDNHIAITAGMWQVTKAEPSRDAAALPANDAHLTALVMAQEIVDRYRAGRIHGTTARRQLEALAHALPASVYDLRIDQVTPEELTSAERVALAHGDQRLGRVAPALVVTGHSDGMPEYSWVTDGVTARQAESKISAAEQRRKDRLARERQARLQATKDRRAVDADTRRARRRAATYGSARNVSAGIEASNATRVLVTPAAALPSKQGHTSARGEVTVRRVVWAVPPVAHQVMAVADTTPEQRFRMNVVGQGATHMVVVVNGATPARDDRGHLVSVPAPREPQRRATEQGKVVTVSRESGRTRIVATVVTQAHRDAQRQVDAQMAADLRSGAANGL